MKSIERDSRYSAVSIARMNSKQGTACVIEDLDRIDKKVLQAVCDEHWTESETLEFKQVLPRVRDELQKHEFLKDVSALANGTGGDLIYGIGEKSGAAAALLPITGEGFDSARRRLAQMLDAGVEPRIPSIRFKEVAVDGGYALIIRIPSSFDGPHRCREERRFYLRNGTHTIDMSYSQLRAAFDRTATLAEGAKQFLATRIDRLIERQTFKSMFDGPICAAHFVPLAAIAGRQQVDVQEQKAKLQTLAMRSWETGSLSSTLNLDGLAVHTVWQKDFPLVGYTQLFRSGAMEATRVGGAFFADRKAIPSTAITTFYREALLKFLTKAKELGIAGPAVVSVAILHVDGYILAIEQMRDMFELAESDRAHIILPEVWIPDIEAFDLGKADELIKPMMDVMWQAFDVERCLEYDDSGTWKPRR